MSTALALSAPPRYQLISAALYPLSPATRTCYGHRLAQLLDWLEAQGYRLDRVTVDLYLSNLELPSSAYNQTVSAIKRLAQAAHDQGLLSSTEAARLGALRLKSLRGIKIGTWLNSDQATKLLQAPDRRTLRGKRDSIVLGLMIGAGLRRSEVSSASIDQFVIRDGRPVLLDVLGKGSRFRTIALPRWTAQWIEDWLDSSRISQGHLVRSISKHGRIGLGLSPVAVWDIVAAYTSVRPHDLRRTFAKLSRAGGAKLEELQQALGHASITTTMRYVGYDLSKAACDSLPLQP